MIQDETETRATFEIVPDEVQMHIASYLDTQSLCFFAASSRRSLGNALAELKQRRRRMLAQVSLQVRENSIFCYTPHSLFACGRNQFGQLGLGHNENCNQLTRVKDLPGTILQVAAGRAHTLVLTDQGVYACGLNQFSRLELADKNNSSTFTQLNELPIELKQWFSRWRQLNHLIAISISDAIQDQGEPEVLPPAAKRPRRL